MKWIPFLFVAAFAFSAAHAQTMHGFTFTWEDPVERTDGVALDPDAEIAGYRLRCEGAENVERTIDRAVTQAVNGERSFEWLGAVQRGGWYNCRMTAFDTDELESDWSEVVQVRKLAQPLPPRVRGMR